MASSSNSGKPQAFSPPEAPSQAPSYKQVAITPIFPTSKLITLAGQGGFDPATGDLLPDFVGQVKQAYAHVATCLKAAGASPEDIIHVRHYVVNQTGNADLDSKDIVERGWGPLWMEFMDREANGHRPPDTVLGVASLAKRIAFYEVEVWAVIHT